MTSGPEVFQPTRTRELHRYRCLPAAFSQDQNTLVCSALSCGLRGCCAQTMSKRKATARPEVGAGASGGLVFESTHPLIKHKVSQMRKASAGTGSNSQQTDLSRVAHEAFHLRRQTQRQGLDGGHANIGSDVRASLHAGAMEHLRTLAMKLES